jgi:hypothetical protein
MDLRSHFQQNPFYHFYLWSQEEMPPPPLVLSLAEENMLADMTELAHRYPVILTHIVTSRLSKILHSLQKQRDPALKISAMKWSSLRPTLRDGALEP